MFVTGTSTSRAYVAATLECHLHNGIAERISCHTLILEAEEDMLFHGQPQQLYDHLPCPRTLMRFSVAEGAGAHCQVGATPRVRQRIDTWLDDTLGHIA
jgi:hypothetical protein